MNTKNDDDRASGACTDDLAGFVARKVPLPEGIMRLLASLSLEQWVAIDGVLTLEQRAFAVVLGMRLSEHLAIEESLAMLRAGAARGTRANGAN